MIDEVTIANADWTTAPAKLVERTVIAMNADMILSSPKESRCLVTPGTILRHEIEYDLPDGQIVSGPGYTRGNYESQALAIAAAEHVVHAALPGLVPYYEVPVDDKMREEL